MNPPLTSLAAIPEMKSNLGGFGGRRATVSHVFGCSHPMV